MGVEESRRDARRRCYQENGRPFSSSRAAVTLPFLDSLNPFSSAPSRAVSPTVSCGAFFLSYHKWRVQTSAEGSRGAQRWERALTASLLARADQQPAAAPEPHAVRPRGQPAGRRGPRQTPTEVRAVAAALRCVLWALPPLIQAL